MKEPSIITLDATSKSTLTWDKERTEALNAIAKGKKILWHIDLGLFHEIAKPLSDKSQFLTLALGLDHFREKIWTEFHKFSLGAALYKGSAKYSISFDPHNFLEWKSERHLEKENEWLLTLYQRDVAADYIEQLAARLTDEVPAYVIFEDLPSAEPLLKAQLTHPDRYPHLNIHGFNFDWRSEKEAEIGICMPNIEVVDRSLLDPIAKALSHLNLKKIKLIPENKLTTSWHELNYLLYLPEATSFQGKRKLQGFVAAGGTLVSLSQLAGFDQEILWQYFIINLTQRHKGAEKKEDLFFK